MFKKILFVLALLSPVAFGQVINCPSGFVLGTSSGCGLNNGGTITTGFRMTGQSTPFISGSQAIIYPSGAGHNGYAMTYSQPVNVQAFTARFTFVAGAQNIAFGFQNNTNLNCCESTTSLPNNIFSSGAGKECGFHQVFATEPADANNIFGACIDWTWGQSYTNQTYAGSTVSLSQTWQIPNMPSDNSGYYWPTDHIYTSPLQLTNPYNSVSAVTTDVIAALFGYDGTNFSMCMYDVTAATGSCSSSTSGTGTFFQHTWVVNIPALVGSNSAYLFISAGSAGGTQPNLLLNSAVYTVNTPPSTPSLTTYTSSQTFTSGQNPPPTPTASPVAGTYSGTQSVTLASSGSSYICYKTFSTVTSTSIFPATDNYAGCAAGSTLYTGAISVASSSTIIAIAGYTHSAHSGCTDSADGTCGGPPSSMTSMAYTISGSTASAPTFSPVAGSYPGTQSVSLSTSSSGAVICYTPNGSTPATNGSTGCTTGTLGTTVSVATSETVKAIAGGTGYTDSSVSSAAYTISMAAAVGSSISGGSLSSGASIQ